MLAGPDSGRCIEKFETLLVSTDSSSMTAHHEEAITYQTQNKRDVIAFVEVDEQLGSPISNFQELVALHTQEVMEDQVVASLTQVYSQGKALQCAVHITDFEAGNCTN